MAHAPTRIKVVHLITLLEFGGAQGNTIHTVENLNKQRFDVELWSGRGAYWDKNVKARFFSSLVRQVNPILDFLALIQLWRALKATRPQVLHTHSSKAGILGRIAGKMAGVPIIIHTFHGFGFNDQQKPWTRWFFVSLEKWIAPLSTKLIFVSESNRETAQTLKIGDPSQYLLIHSGVPIPKIKSIGAKTNQEKIKQSLNIPIASQVVTTVGAFKPQKNLFDFLLAAKQVSQQSPNTHFVILGDGTLRADLEARVQELGLVERVHMPGWREDAGEILAASDVYAMTSLWEGLPRALVEAMILGIPPVCYETDGVKDLLDFREGTLVKQRDINALAQQILRLLEDKAHHSQVSQRVQSAIGPEFDIDGMVRQQEHLYESLLTVDNSALIH